MTNNERAGLLDFWFRQAFAALGNDATHDETTFFIRSRYGDQIRPDPVLKAMFFPIEAAEDLLDNGRTSPETLEVFKSAVGNIETTAAITDELERTAAQTDSGYRKVEH